MSLKKFLDKEMGHIEERLMKLMTPCLGKGEQMSEEIRSASVTSEMWMKVWSQHAALATITSKYSQQYKSEPRKTASISESHLFLQR